jgi:hypothetical protein
VEVDLEARVRVEERADVPHQDARPELHRRAEAEPPFGPLPLALERLLGLLERREDPLARLAEDLPLGRRDDLSPASVEEADLRRALEPAHRVAHGALRPVEALGGGREAAGLHDGVEGAEVGEVEGGRGGGHA